MSDYRTLLIPLRDAKTGGNVLKAAFSVAERFSAHLDVLHTTVDPATLVPLVGEGMSGMMVDELMDAAAKEVAVGQASMRDLFAATQVTGVSATLIEVTAHEEPELIHRGRLADLLVCERPYEGEDPAADLDLNTALMETGRPVLVVPPDCETVEGGSVAISWNGSLQATRAVAGAMPFLKGASVVTVLVGDEAGDGQGLVGHLNAHGIKATAKVLDAQGGDLGAALLDAAGSVQADLMVMGAYTHSRLRQFILGGVTRHVLENAAIPVLMAH